LEQTSDIVSLRAVNEVYIRIDCPEHIRQELREHFTFLVPGYQYIPSYKNKMWDGKIRLFNSRNSTIYKGLTKEIEKFAIDRGYQVTYEGDLGKSEPFSLQEAREFYDSLNLPEQFEERDFQIESFAHCVRNRRALFVSPTGSGKSLMIYMLLRYYSCKTLIIVDSLNLLLQMFSDFADYGFDSDSHVHTISAGKDKWTDKPISVCTWQSAARQDKKWFEQFQLVIGDEAHKFKAKELAKIMESLTDCQLRFGFTGSLDGTHTNKLVLQGLFGPYRQIVTTKQLQEQGTLAQLNIKCITLDYTKEEKKEYCKARYNDELEFLFANKRRNNFLCKLAMSLEGNTLLLFRRIETHGDILYNTIKSKASVPVYYVSGKIKGSEREYIRKLANDHENSIIVASTGVFSTGTNIPNIDNIITAAPTKSQILLLQSIGRGLRKTDRKEVCNFFDVSDNLQWKSKVNHTMKHFMKRVEIYSQQKFNYKLYKVKL